MCCVGCVGCGDFGFVGDVLMMAFINKAFWSYSKALLGSFSIILVIFQSTYWVVFEYFGHIPKHFLDRFRVFWSYSKALRGQLALFGHEDKLD
ncbi:hypothetical protein CEXT_803871 [Caerostris extrusa]|uniref:Uncharacterized protein n=1 Tax=Caerostris extrusa TaxID=172846 RepID=A0AAV4Y499_CAEEX|nr:hypothetical protein CEXT_803871 [Caerostris extrusa]